MSYNSRCDMPQNLECYKIVLYKFNYFEVEGNKKKDSFIEKFSKCRRQIVKIKEPGSLN